MGHCQNKASTQVVPSNRQSNKVSNNGKTSPLASAKKQHLSCTVMISYCWEDKVLCHHLATCLIKDGFQVSIDRDRIHNRFDAMVAREIDDSDIILLCISEAYTHDYYCQKEARYASDEHKTIIAVAVTSDYIVKGWINFVIAYKPWFKLAGSSSDFQMGYKTLVKKLVRHGKLDPSMGMKLDRIVPAKEIEKRRAAYDSTLEKQIAHDQPKILQVKQHIDELSKSIENEPDDKDSKCLADMNALNHWKEKYPHMTWLNVAPFTATGDINDAVFNPPPSAAHDRTSRFRHAIHDFES